MIFETLNIFIVHNLHESIWIIPCWYHQQQAHKYMISYSILLVMTKLRMEVIKQYKNENNNLLSDSDRF